MEYFDVPERFLCITPDGRAAISTLDSALRIGDLCAGTIRALGIEILGANHACIAPSGAWAVVGAFNDLHVLELPSGTLIRRLEKNEISAVAASPNGRFFASATRVGPIRVWPAAGESPVAEIDLSSACDHGSSLAFSPDGSDLSVGTERGVVLRFRLTTAR